MSSSDSDDLPAVRSASKRVFGIMRGMEAPNRYRMKPVTFQAEMCLPANFWLAKQLMDRAAKAVTPTVTK